MVILKASTTSRVQRRCGQNENEELAVEFRRRVIVLRPMTKFDVVNWRKECTYCFSDPTRVHGRRANQFDGKPRTWATR